MRLVLSIALALAGLPGHALDLKLTNVYDLARPASLEYDPTFCGLWLANESRELVLVTLDGLELRRFESDLNRIKAVAIEGENLIVADGFGGFQRLTKSGEALAAPFQMGGGFADTEGMIVTDTGAIITVEDDPERMTWFSPTGEVLRQIDTKDLNPPLIEAQGIARDPRTGHLLIVDDREGTNSLYEFTEDGDLLATQSLLEFGIDPEGIAIRPGSDEMFIAFDQGAKIAAFTYTPTLPDGADALPPGADCMMF